jgi:tight adherence protein C
VIGLLGPDWTIRWLRGRHLAAVENGLPDALDMLVICAEAGLPLEPAIARVGREIRPAHPAVSVEFLQTASEMRIVSDHRLILTQLGTRTGLAGCKRLATTLVQTLQYGTPLVDALRVLAAEMRTELLTRFEARAARLPVLLTLPMIVFILPCVFLVVGGPAIIQVIRVFKG